MISNGANCLLKCGVNSDVIKAIQYCYEMYKNQPQDHVKELQGLCVDDQCRAIFSYLAEHVRYKLDKDGEQYIKSPARLLADGMGDCKSLTMYVSCCLHCLGVSHIIRFVNYDAGKQYTHVYPVAIDEEGNEIILDACEKDEHGYPVYNFARKYAKKQDFIYNEW